MIIIIKTSITHEFKKHNTQTKHNCKSNDNTIIDIALKKLVFGFKYQLWETETLAHKKIWVD